MALTFKRVIIDDDQDHSIKNPIFFLPKTINKVYICTKTSFFFQIWNSWHKSKKKKGEKGIGINKFDHLGNLSAASPVKFGWNHRATPPTQTAAPPPSLKNQRHNSPATHQRSDKEVWFSGGRLRRGRCGGRHRPSSISGSPYRNVLAD